MAKKNDAEKVSSAPGQGVEYTPPTPSINLNFPEKSNVQPEGMDGLGLDEKVTVVITGTVTRVEAYKSEDFGSRSLGVDIETCRIERDDEEGTSLSEAVEKTRRRV